MLRHPFAAAVPSFFVSGGSGFVGKHLLPALLAKGDVTVLTHGDASVATPGVLAVAGDITAAGGIPRIDHDVVLHLAAVSFVPDTVRDPDQAFNVNARGTLNMLEAARKNERLARFVLISSGYVYGKIRYTPIDERHPVEPNNPYGATKLAAEALANAYHHTYGLPTTIIRAFNVYGPGQARHFLIPSIIDQLRQGRRPRLADPRPVRDFTYIEDFVDLILLAATRKAAVGETFNAGTGRGYRAFDVARRLMRIAGVPGEPVAKKAAARAGDIPKLIVDNRKARRLLKWKPRVPFDEGLRATWDAER